MSVTRFMLVLTAGLGLVGCQAKPLLPVASPNPGVAAIQQDAATHLQKPVTWGGVILSTHPGKTQTDIVVLGKALTSSTRPVLSDTSQGRFIARLRGFQDPAIFKAGRELTIYGLISGTELKKVGDFDYLYPVVDVERQHLWPERIPANYDDDGYDPWYGPWYYPYPYLHRHRIIKEVK